MLRSLKIVEKRFSCDAERWSFCRKSGGASFEDKCECTEIYTNIQKCTQIYTNKYIYKDKSLV